jgi:hypothetical protein
MEFPSAVNRLYKKLKNHSLIFSIAGIIPQFTAYGIHFPLCHFLSGPSRSGADGMLY